MLTGFSGQIAVVTGAGRGMGRAVSIALARRGVSVLLVSRTQAELEETARLARATGAAPARIDFLVQDLGKPDASAVIFSEARARLGEPTILINNAALATIATAQKTTVEILDSIWAVNVRAPMMLCSEFLNARSSGKTQEGGAIVNLSSLGGIRGLEKFPGFAPYAATKAAVVSFSECYAVEGRPLGVRVNCIAPGAVDTEMLRKAAPHLKTDTRPEDIAELMMYLCDPTAARAVSGSTVEVFSNA